MSPQSSPEKQTCPRCGGSGIHTSPRTINGELRIMPKNCNLCHGTGQVPEASEAKPDRKCLQCGELESVIKENQYLCTHVDEYVGEAVGAEYPRHKYATPVASEAKHPEIVEVPPTHTESVDKLGATPDEQPNSKVQKMHNAIAKPIETDSELDRILKPLRDDIVVSQSGDWDSLASKAKAAIEALLAQREAAARIQELTMLAGSEDGRIDGYLKGLTAGQIVQIRARLKALKGEK